jgi:hypothetical protein
VAVRARGAGSGPPAELYAKSPQSTPTLVQAHRKGSAIV